MERPKVEQYQQVASAPLDFDIYTEEDGLKIKCKPEDREKLKDYIFSADLQIEHLCKWIKHIEEEIEASGKRWW